MKSKMIRNCGFTLVETIIVVAIFAIVGSISTWAIAGKVEKSRQTVDEKNAKHIYELAKLYIKYEKDENIDRVDIAEIPEDGTIPKRNEFRNYVKDRLGEVPQLKSKKYRSASTGAATRSYANTFFIYYSKTYNKLSITNLNAEETIYGDKWK